MKRYTLHQEVRTDPVDATIAPPRTKDDAREEVWQEVHPPAQFSTRKALEEAFNTAQKILPDGHRLSGRDHKKGGFDARPFFTYKATLEERWQYVIDNIKRILASACKDVNRATQRITDRVVNPDGDVAQEMGWMNETFRAGARITICRRVLHIIKENEKAIDGGLDIQAQWQALYEHAVTEVQRGARFPTKSTSPTANQMAQDELCVWADFAERWGSVMDELKM